MEGKIIGMLMVFALIVAGAGWVLNITTTNELESKVSEARSAIRGIDHVAEQMNVNLDTLKRSKERLSALAEKSATLDSKLQEVRKQVANDTKQAVDLEIRFSAMVDEVRAGAVGTVIPELKLASGRTLLQARVEHVSVDMLSVQHSEGVARLVKKDLPADLAERFQMADPAPGKVAARPKTQKPTAPNPAKIKDLHEQLAVLNAQVRIAESNYVAWQNQAGVYRARYNNARAAGRSVSMVQLTEAEASVVATRKQIIATQAQIESLQNELNALMESQT